jgi:uncharacterized protein (TIGR02594 family)
MTRLAVALFLCLFAAGAAQAHRGHHEHHVAAATASTRSDQMWPPAFHAPEASVHQVVQRRAAIVLIARHHRQPIIVVTASAASASASAGQVAQIAGRYLGGNPTGWSHNWCAHFMNMVLRQAGMQGTGSDEARSFDRIGSPASGPAPGEIAVVRHGHHVGVVLEVINGGRDVLLRSGNHGHRVGDGIYPTSGAVFRSI